MKRRRSADADRVRRRKVDRASAERLRCPLCRRDATVDVQRDGDFIYKRCLRCPFEAATYRPLIGGGQ